MPIYQLPELPPPPKLPPPPENPPLELDDQLEPERLLPDEPPVGIKLDPYFLANALPDAVNPT